MLRERQSGGWVTLKALGRVARYQKSPVIAEVGLGWSERNQFSGGHYRHPEIRFGYHSDKEWHERGFVGLDVRLTLQAHTREDQLDRKGPQGFLTHHERRTEWTGCYSGKLTADYDGCIDAKALQAVLKLIDRARDLRPGSAWDRKLRRDRPECALLQLIVGLRRAGVEVRVYSKRIEDLRAMRQPAPSEAELAA
jgi:hypothetical protein